MIYTADNFRKYGAVVTTGAMDREWLNKRYTTYTSSNDYLGVTLNNGKVGLGTLQNFAGRRSICLALAPYLRQKETITVNQKVLGFVPSSNSCFGISVLGGTEQRILSFGFTSAKQGFVRYVNADKVVVNDVFHMDTGLGLKEDTIEWTFTKRVNDANAYENFTLYVNNRPAYIGNVFCQVGNIESIGVSLLGGVADLAANTQVSNKYITGTANVTVRKYAITDLVIADGQRLGIVAVSSRMPETDTAPNTMVMTGDADSHAALIGQIPPSNSKYLTAVSASEQEMFGAGSFPDLSSENVLAVCVNVLAQKNSPLALDLQAVLRMGGLEHTSPELGIDLASSGYVSFVQERNPWTNQRWTAGEANMVQFGAKVV